MDGKRVKNFIAHNYRTIIAAFCVGYALILITDAFNQNSIQELQRSQRPTLRVIENRQVSFKTENFLPKTNGEKDGLMGMAKEDEVKEHTFELFNGTRTTSTTTESVDLESILGKTESETLPTTKNVSVEDNKLLTSEPTQETNEEGSVNTTSATPTSEKYVIPEAEEEENTTPVVEDTAPIDNVTVDIQKGNDNTTQLIEELKIAVTDRNIPEGDSNATAVLITEPTATTISFKTVIPEAQNTTTTATSEAANKTIAADDESPSSSAAETVKDVSTVNIPALGDIPPQNSTTEYTKTNDREVLPIQDYNNTDSNSVATLDALNAKSDEKLETTTIVEEEKQVEDIEREEKKEDDTIPQSVAELKSGNSQLANKDYDKVNKVAAGGEALQIL